MRGPHIAGLVAVVVSVLAGIWSAVRGQTAAASTSSSSSSSSGSLPDVPGLRDREAKEPGFVAAFLRLIQETGSDGDKLAALISEESGFDPHIRGAAPNPANRPVGFLQWLPHYAQPIAGFTADELAAMTGIQQLQAVRNSIARAPGYRTDPVMQGWGSHIGAADDAILATQDDASTGEAYKENSAYDKQHKGFITAGDVRAAVYGRLGTAATKPRVVG